jgi:hypothetical protein
MDNDNYMVLKCSGLKINCIYYIFKLNFQIKTRMLRINPLTHVQSCQTASLYASSLKSIFIYNFIHLICYSWKYYSLCEGSVVQMFQVALYNSKVLVVIITFGFCISYRLWNVAMFCFVAASPINIKLNTCWCGLCKALPRIVTW